ncbi:MAG: hypothetical protein HY788_05400 [Deltaproteobacteria bacterium]|nr:hypothetical protein [Deltaproteobacteria bacterium]
MLRSYIGVLNAVLLVGIGVLGLLLSNQWRGFEPDIEGPEAKTVDVRPGKNSSPPTEGLLASNPERMFDFYQQVIDLNLFRQDRKEPETPAETEDGAATKEKPTFDRNFKLLGVAVVGDKKLALITFNDKEQESNRIKQVTKMVHEGQEVRDFKIEKVDDRFVIVNTDEEKVEVRLNQAEPSNAAPGGPSRPR